MIKRTTLRLGSVYDAAQEIADRWGLERRSAALRVALRVVAQNPPPIALPADLHDDVGDPRVFTLDDTDLVAVDVIGRAYGLEPGNVAQAARVALYIVARLGLAVRFSNLSLNEEVYDVTD